LRGIPFLDEPYLFGIFLQDLEKIAIVPKGQTFLEIAPTFSKF
jgi:hypothetical protein